MAFLNPDSFYNHNYKAPTSSAFGGKLGSTTATKSASAGTSSGGSSAAPAPPPGFTAQTSTLPPDPAYQQTIGGLTSTRDTTVSGLAGDRQRGLAYYGYNEGADGSLTFDPNNPYSQAALALRNYNQQKTGNVTSYAAAGQLYSGSLKNAQNEAAFQYGNQNNSILGAVRQFLANNTTATQNAINAYNTGAGTALGQSVQNAPNNPLFSAFVGGTQGGALVSTDQNGNMALTGGAGGSALVPQQANTTVKLASGYSIVYGPDGKALYFLDPNGNRMGS